MADEEKGTETAKRTKKAVKDVPLETRPPERPTPHQVREARKADLVAWCEALGLDSGGKVDELRKRLLDHLEQEAAREAPKAEEAAKPEAKPPEAKRPAKKAEKAPAKKPKKEEEEAAAIEHEARAKPKLDARTKALLALRAAKSAQRPRFHRQEWFRYKKFGDEWRKPQGGQSKLRRHFGYRWNLPSIGYRGPRGVRGLHPSGFREVLVHNPKQLEGLDPDKQAVRIARGVGARKRELIEKAAEGKRLRVLNRMVTE